MSDGMHADPSRGLETARRIEHVADLCRTSRRLAKGGKPCKARWQARRQLKKLRDTLLHLQERCLRDGINAALAADVERAVDEIERDLTELVTDSPSKKRLKVTAQRCRSRRETLRALLA